MLIAFQILHDSMVAKHQELVKKQKEFNRLTADMEDLRKEEISLGESISGADAKKGKAVEVNMRKCRTLLLRMHAICHTYLDNFLAVICVI